MKRYKYFPDFFKTLFTTRVQKLSIDGGFTCPNRDGVKSTGGCTFCNNDSFTPGYCRKVSSIKDQIEEGYTFFAKKYKEQKYLAYFQSYSNTYASLEILKQKYQEALECRDVVGLVIGTRPDAIDIATLDYLEELAKKYYVCIEYGVESTNDKVLDKINRGHGFQEAKDAILATAGRGIKIGAHLIFGLPTESYESMINGAIELSELPIDILKLHQLQIIKGTSMATEYMSAPNDFRLYSLDEYLQFVVEVIEKINPNIYLERFVNQAPSEYLIAPKWGVKNFEFVAKLDKLLIELDTYQGKRWQAKHL